MPRDNTRGKAWVFAWSAFDLGLLVAILVNPTLLMHQLKTSHGIIIRHRETQHAKRQAPEEPRTMLKSSVQNPDWCAYNWRCSCPVFMFLYKGRPLS